MASIDAAPTAPWLQLESALDARWLTHDAVRLQLSARSRRDLFPILNLVLGVRLHDLAREALVRDVLVPTKNALGNADKRGNQRDRAKTIRVEVLAARQGVLVAITDEGPGFDVSRALEASRTDRRDPDRGAGFRALDRSAATVSFEHGGRTILICLRHTWTPTPPEASWSAPHSLEAALAPALATTHGAISGCRFFLDSREPRWPLRVATHCADRALPQVFAARRLATEAEARSEWVLLEALERTKLKKLHVPRALARASDDPCLVVYDFDPWMNLWEYLDDRGDARATRRAGLRIGQALQVLQELPLGLPRSARTGADGTIHAAAEPVPSHGALVGANIHYGVDGRFYLSRWEAAAARHPGYDVATFLTDMLAYALARSNHALFAAALQGVAETCASRPETRSWWTELPARMASHVPKADLSHAAVDRSTLLEQALALKM